MARKPTLTGRRVLGVETGGVKPVVAKPKGVKPKAPAGDVGLSPRYGAGLTPDFLASPAGAAEHQALKDLYTARTGRDIEGDVDVRQALSESGLLRTPTSSRGRAVDLNAKKRPAYASAADALDALDRGVRGGLEVGKLVSPVLFGGAGKGLIEGIGKANEVVAPVVDKALEVTGTTPALRAEFEAVKRVAPVAYKASGVEAEVGVLKKAGEWLASPVEGARLSAATLARQIGALPNLQFTTDMSPEKRKKIEDAGGKVGDVPAWLSPFLSGVGAKYYSTPDNTIASFFSDTAGLAPKASAGSKLTYDQLIARQKTKEDAVAMQSFLDTAKSQVSASDIQMVQESSALGPLEKWQRKLLLDQARRNGWDIAIPRDYTDAELARRAFTRMTDATSEVGAGLRRQTAQLASMPAGLVAVGSTLVGAAKSGDLGKVVELGEQFVAPYTYLADDIERRGVEAAVSSFVQERPLDAILIGSAAVGVSGRGAGSVARTVGGTGEALPQLAFNRFVYAPSAESGRVGQALAGLGRLAETDRSVKATVGTVTKKTLGGEFEASTPETLSLPVGVTNKNLWGNAFLWSKARLVERGLRSGNETLEGLATRVVNKSAKRGLHGMATRRDAVVTNATDSLREAAKGLSWWQRERLAVELLRAPKTPDGADYSLGDVAAFWRASADEAVSPRSKALFGAYADHYEKLASVDLDPVIIENARNVARPLGRDSDMLMASVIDALKGMDSPESLRVVRRTKGGGPVTWGGLREGDYINIGLGGEKVPARVTSVELLSDGRVAVTRRNLWDERDVATIEMPADSRVVKFVSDMRQQRYVRDLVSMRDHIDATAAELKSGRVAEARAFAAEKNAPITQLEKLDEKRQALFGELQKRLDSMSAARQAGRLGDVRKFARQYAMKVYALRATIVEMRNEARRAGLPEVEAQMQALLDNIVVERGDLSGANALRVADRAMREQDGVVAAIRSGEMAPVVARRIEQPEARALVENAQRLEARAAELRALEARLVGERDAAPSAAQAGAAARQLDAVRAEIDSLVQQAGGLRRSPSGFVGALGALERRFEFVTGADVRSLMSGKGRYGEVVAAERPALLSVLGELRRKVEDGVQITKDDLVALRNAEDSVVRIEKMVGKRKSYKGRDASIVEPVGFGRKSVAQSIDTGLPKELVGAAFERGARLDELQARVAAREVAPSVATIREVRQMRKAALRQAELNRREAARIVERGRPIVNDANVKVVLDAASEQIAVELKQYRVSPVRFKIAKMRDEVESEWIARAELTGADPVLWVGTRRASFGASKQAERLRKPIDVSADSWIPPSRTMKNSGVVYARGEEDLRNLWMRLLTDTGRLYGNAAWVQDMQRFVDAISIRVDNVDARDAAVLNHAFEYVDESGKTIRLSEGDRVVSDARDWVAISADRRKPSRTTAQTGTVDIEDAGEQTLADLFAQETTPAMVEKGGSYYLIPRHLHDYVTKELADIAYRPTGAIGAVDKLTKQWRAFTLNIFPRTGMANLVGSTILAALAGAGPRSFYLAYRHLKYGDVAAPAALRQGFGASLTTEMSFRGIRSRLPSGTLDVGLGRGLSFDDPFAGLAWWMNTMRTFNGIAEDFGRLAVWYSKAYPAASRLADDGFVKTWTTGRQLSDKAQEYLDMLASGRATDEGLRALADEFTDFSYQWLGDLHAGGKANTLLRIAVPFQQWYRHILRLTFVTMPLKYPLRRLFLQRLGEIGNEYLARHGVYPSWMQDVVPIFMQEHPETNIQQDYILAWHAGSLAPFSTPASFAGGSSGYDEQVINATAGMLNPLFRNLFEVGYSLLTGTAKQVGGPTAISEVKNQAGNSIDAYSRDAGVYYVNTLQGMLPLSSIAVTSSGQVSSGNLLLSPSPKYLRGAEGVLPLNVTPQVAVGDVPGRDIYQLTQDLSPENAIALTMRFVMGGSPAWVIGHGDVEKSQFAAMANNSKSRFTKEMNNILRTAANNAAYEQSVSGSQVQPSVPVPAPAATPVAPNVPAAPVAPSGFTGRKTIVGG